MSAKSLALARSDQKLHDASREPTFTISALAKEFGITTRTIRFYESRGLISPERVGTARRYSKRDRARLILILRGRTKIQPGGSAANVNAPFVDVTVVRVP